MSARKTVFFIVAALLYGLGTGNLPAQDQNTASKPAGREPEAVRHEISFEAYRLDFLISEMEDGKRINSRQYSMNLNTNDSNEIKIGTRVPVDTNTKEGEFQYLDVGINVSARLYERNGQLGLTARAESSSFVPPGQGNESHPAVRQMKIEGSTIVMNDKPIVMGVVDDPNSKRQFQLEVTVKKLR
jgi:hypothetical protein